jgi:hypothetical protein
VVNNGKVEFLQIVNKHARYYGARQDPGVPLLQSLLRKRMEKLHKSARLLGFVAVMGECLEGLEHLARVIQEDEASVAADVKLLSESMFLEQYKNDGTGANFVFRHKFIQETAEALLTAEDCVTAHKLATGVYLEKLRLDSSDVRLMIGCAHHFEGAGMIEQARQHTVASAIALLRHGADKEGKTMLRKLQEHIKTLGPVRPVMAGFHSNSVSHLIHHPRLASPNH